MPRTTSAKKADRASLRKRARNAMAHARLDKLTRTLKRTAEPAAKIVTDFQQAVDKAAKNGLMHPRKASRLKSRLMKTSRAVTTTKPTRSKSAAKKRAAKRTK